MCYINEVERVVLTPTSAGASMPSNIFTQMTICMWHVGVKNLPTQKKSETQTFTDKDYGQKRRNGMQQYYTKCRLYG